MFGVLPYNTLSRYHIKKRRTYGLTLSPYHIKKTTDPDQGANLSFCILFSILRSSLPPTYLFFFSSVDVFDFGTFPIPE
jgi:hypothetical protein